MPGAFEGQAKNRSNVSGSNHKACTPPLSRRRILGCNMNFFSKNVSGLENRVECSECDLIGSEGLTIYENRPNDYFEKFSLFCQFIVIIANSINYVLFLKKKLYCTNTMV
jgi:hypothetical protein